jgi:hypothetical protein
LSTASNPTAPNAIDQLGEIGPATLHPPPLLLLPVPPVLLPSVPLLPPVLLPPVPALLLPPLPLVPALPLPPPLPPPLPAEPEGASLAFVNVQLTILHFAPSAAHLQSESTVHHPSDPFGCEPAALQVCIGAVT